MGSRRVPLSVPEPQASTGAADSSRSRNAIKTAAITTGAVTTGAITTAYLQQTCRGMFSSDGWLGTLSSGGSHSHA